MTSLQRSVKRALVWDLMLQLQQDGLGQRAIVSSLRDKFMLAPENGAATALSKNINANGFIRADSDSLLFRDASNELRARLELIKPVAAMRSDKGYEVRWTTIETSDIERMFDAVKSIAIAVAGKSNMSR